MPQSRLLLRVVAQIFQSKGRSGFLMNLPLTSRRPNSGALIIASFNHDGLLLVTVVEIVWSCIGSSCERLTISR